MRLSEAKKRYRGQWLAFRVEGKVNGDLEGRLIVHAKSRHRLFLTLRSRKEPDLYLTFAGPPVKPGYEILFLLSRR